MDNGDKKREMYFGDQAIQHVENYAQAKATTAVAAGTPADLFYLQITTRIESLRHEISLLENLRKHVSYMPNEVQNVIVPYLYNCVNR